MNSNTTTPIEGQDTPMSNSAFDPTQTAITPTPEVAPSPEESQSSTPEQPAPDADRNFTTAIAAGPDGKKIEASLTVFITRHFQSVEKYTLLQQALKKVFRQYYLSDEYMKPGDSMEHTLAYKALEISLKLVFRWAAQKTLGVLPEDPLEELSEMPGDIVENVFQPEAYEVTTLNPYNTANVEELQKWVETLQSMGHISANVIKSMRKSTLLLEGINDSQGKQIEALTRIDQEQVKVIDSLKAKIDGLVVKRLEDSVQKEDKPNQSSHIELPVFIKDDYDSEIELVRRALTTAAETKLNEILESVCNGEVEEAFFSKEEYDSIQNILDRLAVYVAILSCDNHASLIYHQDNRQYQHNKKRRHNELMTRKAAFIDAYSTMESDDEEDELDKLDAEFDKPEPDLLPIPDPEPPYLIGLDAQAKQVMLYNATQGLSVEQLIKMRSFLYPESQEKPLPWEAAVDQDQSASTQQ